MKTSQYLPHTTLALLLSCLTAACGPTTGVDDDSESATTNAETSGSTDPSSSSSGDGDGDMSTGDGDPTTGDGDGDPSTGDGDGDETGEPDACDDPAGLTNPAPGALGHSEIAHWKYDRPAVLSINFDDSTPGQAQIGVPAMIERGLTGTWFVNPGGQAYMDNLDAWQTLAPANFQELANHTMDHAGAMSYADAEYQIGEAAAIIRSLYPPERSPLIAFNRGGGTNWDAVSDVEYQQLLDDFYCVERVHSSGIAPATPGQTMYTALKDYMQDEIPADNWTRIHFHGICDPSDVVNCVCDSQGDPSNCREYGVSGVNNGAVQSTDFLYLLDQLVSDPYFTGQVWIAGFTSAHKYQTARPVSEGVVASASDDLVELCLVSELDAALYDEELTVTAEVPPGWNGCVATQGGHNGYCRIIDGLAHFEARIDAGVIELGPG